MPSSKTRVIRYHLSLIKLFTVNKQIFHAFFYNIRDYSPKVINIILLPRVNNFDIKQKSHGIFVLLHATNTKQNMERLKTNKTQQISVKTFFFCKN